jgi:hypothetical protein
MGQIESELSCFISAYFQAHKFYNVLSRHWHSCCQKYDINRIFSCHVQQPVYSLHLLVSFYHHHHPLMFPPRWITWWQVFLTSVSTFLLFFVYFLSFIPLSLSLFLLVVILYSTSLVFCTLEMNFVVSNTLHVSIPLFVTIGHIMSSVHHNWSDAQNSIQQVYLTAHYGL